MGREPTALAEVLQRAQMNPRQLAGAINAWLERRGRSSRRIDPTAPYSWVRHGYRPYNPIPSIAAAVLSEHLGHPVTVDQLWPNRRHTAMSAASGLDCYTNVDDMLLALS